jgi:hypothetical protein
MGVHVDQAGEEGDAGKLDHFGGGGDLKPSRVPTWVMTPSWMMMAGSDHPAGCDVEQAVGGDVDILRHRSGGCGRQQAARTMRA